ncbi:DNA cytosine methyltransferase [uncultured Veillonella sp.]|jgi:DNA (cytosine-5-)-methyltransferase|uniref:DNA cytosine methyltransferase n=1 Tax=uncultured Veillonella sp. TaxID=159268 RepID=UPI0025DF21F7|nr:DNA cytosine methyltransferase [uncultured Veillonella sp.]
MKPTVIDLFAGVGGLSLGFEMEGFDILLANEFDQSIATAYKENHKSTNVVVGDITSLDLSKVFGEYVNKIDVVIGGPPCQGFSQKGKRKTINDERNFLFKHYVEVVKFVKPKYFVMENVPNLLTAEKGFFLNEIKGLFKGYGYSIRYGILNAADYGVPQNRRRAIIIGKYLATPPELPLPCKQKVTIWDAISDLAYLESGEGEFEQEYRNSPKSDYEKKMRKGSKILYNHMATKHSALALERLSLIPPNAGKEVLPKEHITKSVYSGTWSRMKQNDVAVTITTRFDTPSSGKFTHPFLNRAITVREAARLQSFPDTFKFIGSKMSQMKQVGNAVPPLLARKIARVIMHDIKRDNNE